MIRGWRICATPVSPDRATFRGARQAIKQAVASDLIDAAVVVGDIRYSGDERA
jgi:hypothetical protein